MDRHLSMHFFGLFWFGCLTYGSLVKSHISVFKTKVLNQLTPGNSFHLLSVSNSRTPSGTKSIHSLSYS